MAATTHDPVMVDRVVDLLAVRGDDVGQPCVIVDCTVGAGGHATALLGASRADVHLLGFDRDPDALELAGRRLAAYAGRATLVHAAYDDVGTVGADIAARIGPVVAVLYDLGVSSMQLDRAQRGFSFRVDAPLDMRMDPTGGETAADLIDRLGEAELAGVLRSLGEERFSGRIARAIVAARPITTTRQLTEVVVQAVPAAARRQAVHPATRTFQALRIAVNAELERFSASLPQALDLVAPAPASGGRGGRVAVLAYHSLEDRIAKRAFAEAGSGCVCPPDLPVCGCGRVAAFAALTRGAERPSDEETSRNPRARSARLRAVERLHAGPAATDD